MTVGTVSGVRIAGLASALPETTQTVSDVSRIFGDEEAAKISKSIGVLSRHIVQGNQCTSDLCAAAAERLLVDMGWAPASVGALLFVSQTPDHLLPATSCLLHGRLGLASECAAFDINLGCSGYVYGLWLASLIASSGVERVLLLAGDTISRIVSPGDRATVPLFGDAGTATAIERSANASPIYFSLGSDGSGAQHLIVPAGGFRTPHTSKTSVRDVRDHGNVRSDEDLYMDGAEVFTFTLREVPPLIDSVLALAGWSTDIVDAFVFHQANKFMLQYIARKIRIPTDKMAVALEQRGNTSSASIPLALSDKYADALRSQPMNLVMAGFGVGLSWAAAAVTTDGLIVSDLVVVPPTPGNASG